MHVALYTHSVVPVRGYGGTQRVVIWLARGLAELGHQVTLLAPIEVRENVRARAAAEAVAASNGPIGRVEYADVRQSMRNGGGPACLRLRVVLTEDELAGTNPAQRLTPELHERLNTWAERHYRDRLAPADLADPKLLDESRAALDELTQILDLGSGFYPFQR